MYLSVIIPTKNDERHIRTTVQSVFDYLTGRSIDHEIIVVVNNSTDRTEELLNDIKSAIPTLRIISYQGTVGKGYAVKTGMLQASGQYRLFMDADNATKINELAKMMPFFQQSYDVVIGSIAVEGKKVMQGSEPWWRILFGKMGNLFIQIMAVPGIHDTQRGFKIFSARAADDIFPQLRINRWGFDIEVLALARKYGHKIKEVGVEWNNDIETSKVSLSAYVQVLLETVKIRLNLLTGKYKKKPVYA